MKIGQRKKAIIVGGGPAGLTAALELLRQTDIVPVVFESSEYFGGISKTIEHNGNRIDIGGHRFFSKSDTVMRWWTKIIPLENPDDEQFGYLAADEVEGNPGEHDVMLVRSRKSRIYFSRKLFDYPISLSLETILGLGFFTTAHIGFSYIKAITFPIKEEKSLRDFLVNRFGHKLYSMFFESYTEKVWGVPCEEISPEWGAQRIKGLSITKAIGHALKSMLPSKVDEGQKKTETSLIDNFLYPKRGPGQMWDRVATIVGELGGEIHKNHSVISMKEVDGHIASVEVINHQSGEIFKVQADYVFSTTDVKNLINGLGDKVPDNVKEVANGLQYRGFMTAGLLVDKLLLQNKQKSGHVSDNWIYIQESDVKLGRLQIFNNWSPGLVKDSSKVWVGLEYFCDEGDDLWNMPDDKFGMLASEELAKINIIEENAVEDYVVIREAKAYPAYFGTYDRFNEIRDYVDKIENLYLVGRNGMHRYNNQDHSMLAAITAVRNIAEGRVDKENIWTVNAEKEYHEEK